MAIPDSTCPATGCEKPAARRNGYCDAHYRRLLRRGATDDLPKLTLAERFWAKVNKNGPLPKYRPDLGPCWVWTAAIRGRGYGVIGIDGRMVYAHRVAYEMTHGAIPEKRFVDHMCHNSPCVNPSHLRLLTNKQNTEHRRGLFAHNTSGATGVHCEDNVWIARVNHEGVTHRLGRFSTFEEAKSVAEEARVRLFTHYIPGADAA